MFLQRLVPSGLLPRLVLGIFLPVLIAFISIAMIFISVKNLATASLQGLGASGIRESTAFLNKLGEKLIEQKAQDVAKQIETYMAGKAPDWHWAKDRQLRWIAVQKVGETGYTAVHDDRGVNFFHSNTKIVGTDLHSLSKTLPEFVKILDAGLQVQASGYYNWRDRDGSIRPKYMVTVPVHGTNLIVAATTYIDEFSKPSQAITTVMNEMRDDYTARYNNRFVLFLIIVTVVLVVLLAALFLWAYSVVRPIQYLSQVANRISMGDLDTIVSIRGKGEVTVLAESIERMRISVRAVIERLHKVRQSSVSVSTESRLSKEG